LVRLEMAGIRHRAVAKINRRAVLRLFDLHRAFFIYAPPA